MAKEDPMAPITRLPNLAFVDETASNNYSALYTPIRTQQEVIDIPVTANLTGAIVFNKDTEELETYTAAGFWLPILTAESDINVETLTAVNVNATNADFTHIHSNDITNDTVITTLGLLVQGDAQINDDLVVQDDLIVQGTFNAANGGISGDFGVNGTLSAGALGTTGNLLVDGNTTLQDVTIQGDLTVTGFTITDVLNATNINALDISADSIQAETLLYGLTNLGGSSPIIVTLDVGAGTGATYNTHGSILGFTLNISTGSTPALGVIATLKFPTRVSSLVNGVGCVLHTPAAPTTAQYETTSSTYVTCASGTTVALFASSVNPLAASTTYSWNFMVVGNQLGT
jgi:hypothetical protein